MSRAKTLRPLSEHLYVLEDTCNVYLVRVGEYGLLIDAGSGAIAELLATVGIRSCEWVLHTHFHRDQCWGTPRLVEQHAIHVAVPEHERYLFESAREHWRTRRVFDNYNGRSIALAPGEDIPVDAELLDYEAFSWRGISFYVLPAKGHTLGSVALLAEIDGRKVAFTGDLLTAGGHVHQLHGLEYSYGDLAGVLYTLQSLKSLRRHQPDVILPSHGVPIDDVRRDIDLLERRLVDVVRLGSIAGATGAATNPAGPDAASLPEPEFIQLSEHLLWSGPWTCANFYVLLSGTGEAMLIDYGHAYWAHMHIDRDQLPFESMRFIAHRLDQLKDRFGVDAIEVVCATHAHDDHVCGIPYLQRHHGTACWALDAVAGVLARPADWAGLRCTYPKPIEVHRRMAHGDRVAWRGFELTFYEAPGHAEFHSIISGEIDERTVAFTGDNYFLHDVGQRGQPLQLAHHTVLSNGFRLAMYQRSVDVLRVAAPDLICPGHGEVLPFDSAALDQVDGYVKRATRAFRAVVADPADLSIDSSWVRMRPYLATVAAGATLEYTLALRNNLGRRAIYAARLLPPPGWSAADEFRTVSLDKDGSGELRLSLTAPTVGEARRTVVTVEVLIDGRSEGPIAEALVTVGTTTGTPTSCAPEREEKCDANANGVHGP